MKALRHNIVAVALMSLANVGEAADWRTISFTSDSMFPVQTTGSGTMTFAESCVCFRIDRLELRLKNEDIAPTEIQAIRIGLAYEDGPASWNVYGYGKYHLVGLTVSNVEGLAIGPFESAIPIPEGLGESEHWVVVEMVTPAENNKGYGTIYAYEKDEG